MRLSIFTSALLIFSLFLLSPLEGAESKIEQALKDLKGRSYSKRRVASKTLVKMGKKAVPHLVELLGHSRTTVRSRAARVLVKIGEDAVPGLIKALQSPKRKVRYTAADTLGDLEVKAAPAIPGLIALLDKSYRERREAGEALKKIGSPALAPLKKAMAGGNSKVKREIEKILPHIGTGGSSVNVDMLLKQLQHPKSSQRKEAAKGFFKADKISKKDQSRVFQILSKACDDKEKWVRIYSIRALAIHCPESLEWLMKTLEKNQRRYVRYHGLKTMLERGEKVAKFSKRDKAKIVSPMIKILRGKNRAYVRAQAALVLGELGDLAKPAVSVLADQLSDKSEALRRAATVALGKIGPAAKKALPALRNMVKSGNRQDRKFGNQAISKIEK